MKMLLLRRFDDDNDDLLRFIARIKHTLLELFLLGNCDLEVGKVWGFTFSVVFVRLTYQAASKPPA